jgi:ectoine hydroxylase-related dioxygenase (phytanoyl-CoA dioxygenase family)
MTSPDMDPAVGIRSLTDEEILRYREHGWVKLDGLLAPELVKQLLNRGKQHVSTGSSSSSRTAFDRWDACSARDAWIRTLSHSGALAGAASQLMAEPVRFYYDTMFVKPPARNNGRDTPWHQDLPQHPFDRRGLLNIWVALVDCPPAKGTMRFLSGSQRAGSLGRHLYRTDGVDLVQDNPWLLEEYELTPPLHLREGDATVHDLAIAHCAPENTTDSARWAYIVQWIPAAALYNGAPNRRTDGLGLQVGQPLDHPNFPILP